MYIFWLIIKETVRTVPVCCAIAMHCSVGLSLTFVRVYAASVLQFLWVPLLNLFHVLRNFGLYQLFLEKEQRCSERIK